jgi:hypothetical protein
VGYIERKREKRNAYRLSVGKPVEWRLVGRPRSRWVELLGRILEGKDGVVCTGLVWLRWSVLVNELSGSKKGWETIEWLHNWWTLEQYSIPES